MLNKMPGQRKPLPFSKDTERQRATYDERKARAIENFLNTLILYERKLDIMSPINAWPNATHNPDRPSYYVWASFFPSLTLIKYCLWGQQLQDTIIRTSYLFADLFNYKTSMLIAHAGMGESLLIYSPSCNSCLSPYFTTGSRRLGFIVSSIA